MLSGFVIGSVEILDRQLHETYASQAIASVDKYRGEFMVRGGRYQRLEGDDPLPSVFVVKFPSYEEALAWYHSKEFQSIIKTRTMAQRSKMIVVEGID
jgi:uncharacterized protein (DUF1330 family)